MGALKVVGIVLLVLSVPLVLAGVVWMFSDDPPIPSVVQDDPEASAYIGFGVGALFLLAGIILMLVGPRTKIPRGATTGPAQPQHVEIKRTEMNWGASQVRAPADALQEALDDVNRKMGQLKVQYGMGQISNESYKLLMAQYEKERSQIEQQIIAQGQ